MKKVSEEAMSEPIKSGIWMARVAGMRVKRANTGSPVVTIVAVSGSGYDDPGFWHAEREDGRLWSGLATAWDNGEYEILYAPPVAAPESQLSSLWIRLESPGALPPWVSQDQGLEWRCSWCYGLAVYARRMATGACEAHAKEATVFGMPTLVPQPMAKSEAKPPAPWKCAQRECKTPTAGQSKFADLLCMACADTRIARSMAQRDAERVPAVKPDPVYFPPGESTMGGSWRSGGAMWRPTGGG
jgi:hypothetical protein